MTLSKFELLINTLATFLVILWLSLHMLAKHWPNCFELVAEPSITLSRSLCKKHFFSVSDKGYYSISFALVIMAVTSLVTGEKLGWVNEPPISILFSPGWQRGLFLPSKKSQAFSTKWTLKKNSKPVVSGSTPSY